MLFGSTKSLRVSMRLLRCRLGVRRQDQVSRNSSRGKLPEARGGVPNPAAIHPTIRADRFMALPNDLDHALVWQNGTSGRRATRIHGPTAELYGLPPR
jgi:hypothetical protein